MSALSAVSVAAPAGAQDPASEAAIRAIVADQVAAWNAGDGARYARHVSADVSFTNLFGMVMYGARAFTDRHAQILATFYKGTTKRHEVRRIRFVTPDVAIVDIDNEVRGVTSMPDGIAVPADGVIRTRLMEVFGRRDGRWWIEAYHNVDVKPTAPRESDREQQIVRLEQAWREARIRGDTAFLDSLYAKEFRVQGTNGKVISREADIAGFASGDIRPEVIDAEEMNVALYGDVAVVTGLDRLKGRYKGRTGEGRVRFTDVFVWRDGRWQLVAIQGTWANNP